MPSTLRFTFIAAIFLTLGTIVSFAQCKEIHVEAKVVKEINDNKSNQSIILEIKASDQKTFLVNVFGPDRNNILNSEKTEFNDLVSGKYLLVIVGRTEKDNYCPKSINVTIN